MFGHGDGLSKDDHRFAAMPQPVVPDDFLYARFRRDVELAHGCRVRGLYVADDDASALEEDKVGLVMMRRDELPPVISYLRLELLGDDHLNLWDDEQPDLSMDARDIGRGEQDLMIPVLVDGVVDGSVGSGVFVLYYSGHISLVFRNGTPSWGMSPQKGVTGRGRGCHTIARRDMCGSYASLWSLLKNWINLSTAFCIAHAPAVRAMSVMTVATMIILMMRCFFIGVR